MTPHAPEVPPAFGREHGVTLPDWLRTLPEAVAPHGLQLGRGQARVALPGGGTLALQWTELPPRQIALVQLPRLQVDYRFEGADEAARKAFMTRFDLVMQRGGG